MSWKRSCCARAFSSDMWLMPKNWLSPNSSRSIAQALPAAAEEARACDGDRGARASPAPTEAPVAASATIIPIVRSVAAAAAKSLSPSGSPAQHLGDERFDLGAVLLAAQVEPDRLGQLGRVADVPALLVAGRDRRRVAQVDLAFLAVGEDPPAVPQMFTRVVILR